MNNDFCRGCEHVSDQPECIIGTISDNVRIEDIINGAVLPQTENLICHKGSQSFSDNRLSILNGCDDCNLCYIACPYINGDCIPLFTSKLEKAVFNDLGKAGILFASLLPDASVAVEVHVKGDSRDKRIDLVIRRENTFYLIKLLNKSDKIPFYARSYDKVIAYYSELFNDCSFISAFLVPASALDESKKNPVNAKVFDISELYELLGGN